MGAKSPRTAEIAMEVVHRDPARAIELAERELAAGDTSVRDRARAFWARGMARRERDDLRGAESDLDRARMLAIELPDSAMAAQIDVTRSLVLAYSGRTDEALRVIDRARGDLDGVDRARLDTQHGLIEQRRGNLDEALAHYRDALPVLEASEDAIATARLHANMGALHVYRDDAEAAVPHCLRAAELAAANDQRLLRAGALHNLGYAQGRLGRIIDALASMAEARALYSALPMSPMSLALGVDHAAVLHRANLIDEAQEAARRAVEDTRTFGNETDLADALLLASECDLAAGAAESAMDGASEALLLFAEQARDAWRPVAELARLRAARAGARPVGPPIATAAAVAERLDALGWRGEALDAWLIAVRDELARDVATGAVGRLADMRNRARRAAPTQRAAVSLASALVHESNGRRADARRAVAEGLRTLAENQVLLGSTDLRAHAVGHARGLCEVGLRMAIVDRRPREFVERMERSVGVLSLLPRVRPSEDEVLEGELTELRGILSRTPSGDVERAHLDARRRELEDSIRDRARHRSGDGRTAEFDLRRSIERLAERTFVDYAVVGGRLWACSIVSGRARLDEIGEVGAVRDGIESLTFAIGRLHRARISEASRAAASELAQTVAGELRGQLVPRRVRDATGPVVVAPTELLHGLAWPALLQTPSRPLSIVPSLSAWVRADDATGPRRRHVLLVAGPDLLHADDEAARIAAMHEQTTTLVGRGATVGACLEALEHADIAHFACHGRFRGDNPMFSSLRVADGELTIYDLERCRRVPPVIVMSSCDAGRSTVLSGGALIGLASALIQLGVASVIAPLTPVNDERSVDLMVQLHSRLAVGDEPGRALAIAGGCADAFDPIAAPFICFGR